MQRTICSRRSIAHTKREIGALVHQQQLQATLFAQVDGLSFVEFVQMRLSRRFESTLNGAD